MKNANFCFSRILPLKSLCIIKFCGDLADQPISVMVKEVPGSILGVYIHIFYVL